MNLAQSLCLFFFLYLLAFLPGYFVLNHAKTFKSAFLALLPLHLLILTLPFLISPEHRLIRFFLFIPLFSLVIQNLDQADRIAKDRISALSFRKYLSNMVSGFGGKDPGAPGKTDRQEDIRTGIRYLRFGLVKFLFTAVLLLANNYFRTPEWGYWISVASKVLYFYIIAVGLTDLYYGFCLLAGQKITPIYQEPLLATSPWDFWSNRVNLYVSQSLYKYVFIPLANRAGAATGVLATFLFSGLIHEIQFDVSANKITGCLLLFFALQGLAVAAELTVKKTVRRRFTKFYKRASRSPALPFILVPLQIIFMILTGSIALKSFDLIIDLHNIEPLREWLNSFLPSFP
ncbi:MAG: MBOAT family protein [bacterium]|nr:MBOAT family protein [bacterium]